MKGRLITSVRPGHSEPNAVDPFAEPTYTPATDTLLLTENFDEYIDSHDMYVNRLRAGAHLAQNDGNEDVGGVTLITGRNGTGNAARLTYAGTNQEAHVLDSYNLPATVSKTIILTEYRRVTMGTPLAENGSSGSQMATKWMMFWQEDVGGDSTRFQFNTHDHSPWVGSAPVGCLWQSIQGGYNTDDNAVQPVGPYATDLFNAGLWNRYTYMFRPHTSMTQKDGYARMWINGTLIMRVDQAAATVTPPGGYKEWCSQQDVDKLSLNLAGTAMLTTVDFLKWMDVLTVPASMPGGFTVDIDDVQVFNRP